MITIHAVLPGFMEIFIFVLLESILISAASLSMKKTASAFLTALLAFIKVKARPRPGEQAQDRPHTTNPVFKKKHTTTDKTGDTNSLDIALVYVQGGSFDMGSNDDSGTVKTVHRVTLSNFYIGKYQVTQAQWKAVMGNNPSHFQNCDNCPVEQVSWNDAQDFIEKLNQKTGKNYRLPTEAEWEYAARGGNKSNGYAYSGSNDVNAVAWYGYNCSKTHPAGEKRPNELGIYDMSGNVLEWCQDRFDGNYYSNSPPENPQGPPTGSDRVLRGGSWYFTARRCGVAFRTYFAPGLRDASAGFRLVFPAP